MGYRIHTAEARYLMAQTGTDAEIEDQMGNYQHDHGDTSQQHLVLNDSGNQEAFVVTGTPAELVDFGMRVLAAVGAAELRVLTVTADGKSTTATHATTTDDGTLKVGDTDRTGTLQIHATRWDGNGTLTVTVRVVAPRDTYGVPPVAAMRRLARRALMYPERTRSSRTVKAWSQDGHDFVAFAVSRLND